MIEESEPIATHFDVWAMNCEALNIFLACSDDWKTDAKGRYKSIDKTAMKAVMDMMKISDTNTMLTDLIAMQDAVLELLQYD